MSQTRVSVIIPAFNAEAYLEQAVQSVLAQTMGDVEVLVVDDCSLDETLGVANRLAARDARVRVYQSAANRGPGHARNIALQAANGEWVTMLDADDWYDRERLATLLEVANNTGANIIADNQRFITAADGSWNKLLIENSAGAVRYLSMEDYLRGDRVNRASRNLGLLKPFIRRSLLTQHNIGYDDNKKLSIGEDFYFLLECLQYERQMVFVSTPHYNYRVYDPSMLTKRQTVDSYIDWKNMHARFAQKFDAQEDSTVAALIEARGHDIERYIQFRRIVDPLKFWDFAEFFRQVKANPKSLILLLNGVAFDPGSIVLFLRYSVRNVRQRLSLSLR
ncbi:MAG: hypothetical protein CMK83_07475 [Pseudomonadales bacterium]|jgi:succinoglycan biosynthesis protein ExoO|uniref:glycosyltransferase family 2 protein n=1 Tax=unclassified Ketobacter TaxID=2639109 RepID=UPI000C8F3FEC|nr:MULTISPECIES: glycosyltransferase family 2 protein [unclassified Ketobacter]MAQ24047.1 hypothetical protein [Pseudomonadales bacterium]HAG94773.1 hypothetical protein [Gammaproteobacteria bacterium]RLT87788.1 MAG: glycosyltransferase family 2 protein [Ketobacter sp. GenoA1]RLT96548.1 MAG: glycosyltransferase family 2 protein [Ketobacter sp.]HAU13763.1 hypothetical protein [Gammaproteobacteria bacterium]|tara:strand:- start:306 stop:1310 length:1005 start_codon:yes stop_codon:yes gene_type:complete